MVDLAMIAPLGALVEVGVYRGGSAAMLEWVAYERGQKLYLYDTFTGIPNKTEFDLHQIGDFSDTSAELVAARFPRACVVVGEFPQSLVRMPPVGFVHCDCDQYQSVRAVCEKMPPLMVDGGIILFDDWPALEGCRKAVRESFSDINFTEENKAYVIIRKENK